jgi:hypothetical protein
MRGRRFNGFMLRRSSGVGTLDGTEQARGVCRTPQQVQSFRYALMFFFLGCHGHLSRILPRIDVSGLHQSLQKIALPIV